MEKAAQYGRSAAEADEAAARLMPQLFHRAGQGVEQLTLDCPITQLRRIQFGRIGRQPLDLVVCGMAGDKVLHDPGPVRIQAIAHYDERPAEPSAEIPQSDDDL